jgi:predicted nucleotidyltransferase
MAGPGLEQEFLARAQRVELDGVDVPVLSPEDLVVTKILAARPKDVEDVAGILLARGENLDLSRIRGTLTLIEQALGQSDLLAEFETQLARTRGLAR